MSSEDTTARLPRAVVDLEERLTALEQKFLDRRYDTRPIFEAHEERLKILENTISKLGSSRTKTELTFDRSMLWAEGDLVPFCPHCFESAKPERRHLQAGDDPGQYWCTKCKNHYRDPTVPEAQTNDSNLPFGVVIRDDEWE